MAKYTTRHIVVDINKWDKVVVLDLTSTERSRFLYEVGQYVCQDQLVTAKYQDIDGRCVQCGAENMAHGWLGDAVLGQKICPGTYIVTVDKKYYPIDKELIEVIFESNKKAKDVTLDAADNQIDLFK